MHTKRKTKEIRKTYLQRWLENHPRIWLYLTKNEYEYLSNLANKEKKSYKELLLETLRFMKEEYPKLKIIKEENNKLKKEKEQLEKTITQLQKELATMKEKYNQLKKEKEELEELISQLQEIRPTKIYDSISGVQARPKR